MSAALGRDGGEGSDCINVVLLGVGAVGRELLTQIASPRNRMWRRVRVCALIDRGGYVSEARGFSRRELRDIVDWKSRGRSLGSLPSGRKGSPIVSGRAVDQSGIRPGVLVDVTAADTHEILERGLRRGWDVVLANKRPIAGTQSCADRLVAAARHGAGSILHEATVGAGLPVIETLKRLLESGDRVLAIDACPSGTLGFLCGRVGDGVDFSAALRQAMEAGYTEPDPRDDLSGLDVARKALILGRMIGFRGELDPASIESLVPVQLRNASPGRFIAATRAMDAMWRGRVNDARSRGAVLRYRARVTTRRISIGLAEVAADDTLGALKGPDNLFAFTTARYRSRPLVIAGPGAGAAVTAAGVHGDILRALARRIASHRHVFATSTAERTGRNSARPPFSIVAPGGGDRAASNGVAGAAIAVARRRA